MALGDGSKHFLSEMVITSVTKETEKPPKTTKIQTWAPFFAASSTPLCAQLRGSLRCPSPSTLATGNKEGNEDGNNADPTEG